MSLASFFYWGCSDPVDGVYEVNKTDALSSQDQSSGYLSSIGDFISQGESVSSELDGSSESSNSSGGIQLTDLKDLEITWSQFPTRQISPEQDFWLKWDWNISSGEIPGEVKILYQKLDTKYELSDDTEVLLQTANPRDSVLMDFIPFKNSDRIRMIVEYENPEVAGGLTRDMTSYFDIHNGVTLYTYEDGVQEFFKSYCTGCHGTAGGLALTSYSLISQGNTPLYIMNRVNFIGDMPPEGNPLPSVAEKAMLRDWILGGFPKN